MTKSVLVDKFESRIKSLGLSDSEKKTVVETNKKVFLKNTTFLL